MSEQDRDSAPRYRLSRVDAVAFLAIFAAVLALFAPALGYEFVFDDSTAVLEDERLRSLSGLGRIWSEDIWGFKDYRSGGTYYRPMLGTYLWFLWHLFGSSPAGYHAGNLLLHAFVAILCWLLARRLGMGTLGAAIATTLVVLHPVRIQNAAWVVGFVDPFITVALLAATLMWMRGGVTRWASLAVFAVTMLTIERAFSFMAVPVVLSLLGLDRSAPNGPLRIDLRRGLKALALLCIPFATALVLRTVAGVPLFRGGGEGASAIETLWTAPVLADAYIKLLLWPAHLALTYPVHLVDRLQPASLILPGALAAVAVAGSWKRPRRVFLASVAALLMGLPLLAKLLPPGELVSDRYLYVSATFGAIWLGDVIDDPRRPKLRWILLALVVAWSLALLGLHRSNLRPWSDELALYTRSEEVCPGHPKFTMNLSNARRKRGLGDPGCALLRSALATSREGHIRGDDVQLTYNLGNCLREIGEPEAALDQYAEATALSHGVFYPARYNQVVALLELDRDEEAWEAAGLLINEAPQNGGSWRLRGICNVRLGRWVQARNCFERALETDPGDADASRMLERVLEELEEAPEAQPEISP